MDGDSPSLESLGQPRKDLSLRYSYRGRRRVCNTNVVKQSSKSIHQLASDVAKLQKPEIK